MFYRHEIKGKKSAKKEIVIDPFSSFFKTDNSKVAKSLTQAQVEYNFDLSEGGLKPSYGFKKLQMPTSFDDLDREQVIELDGNEIYSLWSFRWYDKSMKTFKYYLVYYNDLNNFGFVNLFNNRPIVMFLTSSFTKTPTGCNTRYQGDEAIIFSSPEVSGLHLMTGTISMTFPDLPKVLDACNHYNNIYAIIAGERPKLVFTQKMEMTKWTDGDLVEITFNDDLGAFNKILAFNDYVYVFRDYGINKISVYSTQQTYDTSLIYQSDSFIHPRTIASAGDKIYFMEDGGLFEFNGSTAKKLDFGNDEILRRLDLRGSSAVCFEGKYYLACRHDFDDGQSVACENGDYVNNVLFVFDFESGHVDVVRGVDICDLCAIVNPYKSKLIACFNGDNKDKIGQLTHDGQVFGQSLPKVWTSVLSSQDSPEKLKGIIYFTIKSSGDCTVTLTSEESSVQTSVCGSDKIQRFRVNLTGREIKISISADSETTISNVKIGYSEV